MEDFDFDLEPGENFCDDMDMVTDEMFEYPKKENKYAKGGPTKAQSKKVGKVMHEWKSGKLHSGSKKGPIVKDQKQAVAIALSEAGISKKETGGGLKGEQKQKYLIDLSNDNVKKLVNKISDKIHLIEEDPFVYASPDGSLYVANDGILFEQKHKKFIDDILSEAGISKDDKPTGWKHKRKK